MTIRNNGCGAGSGAGAAQFVSDYFQFSDHSFSDPRLSDYIQSSLCDLLRLGLVLDELRDDFFPTDDIYQTDVRYLK